MADFAGLFGTPLGDLGFADLQDKRAQTAERAAQTQHLQELAKEANVRTQQAKVKMQQEQIFLQKLAGYQTPKVGSDGAGNPMTQADVLDDMATMMINSGLVKDGTTMADKANLMRRRDAQTKQASEAAKEKLSQDHVKAMNDLYSFLSTANDAESFERGKRLFLQQHPDETLPPAFNAYDPNTVAQLRQVTKAGAEIAKRRAEKERQDRIDERAAVRAAEREEHDNRVTARNFALENLRQNHRIALKKAGGDGSGKVGNATRDDVSRAQSMLEKEFPALDADVKLGNTPVSSAAVDLANDAKALMAKNKGLSKSEAMQQAFARMKLSGAFTKDYATKPWYKGGGTTEKDSYRPSGAVVKDWTEAGGKPEPGVTYAKGGKYYQFDAKAGGMREVPKPQKRSSAPPPAEESDSEDDDE